MAAPTEVVELVERFDRNRDAYRHAQYNETQVRLEFIDPLFMALGWDVHNTSGYAEAYKDVIHEDAIKVGGVTNVVPPPPYFIVGMIIPRRMIFWQKRKTIRVGIEESTSDAIVMCGYPAICC